MSFLSKLFGGGGGGKSASEPAEDYEGFRIIAQPQADAGGHRICALIEKEIDGDTKTHTMVRADMCQSRDEAVTSSTLKAKRLIDEQGEAIFR
ncbi:HlyU family transcriptional regulator [Gymnodinialimonas hymeniacidonis]|uniref:HlyU family transcriptional regulator n=1 Tax=Gymnodinialimonas hymeniacidonis TaxID=3126508 RepID=UPI0034C63F78